MYIRFFSLFLGQCRPQNVCAYMVKALFFWDGNCSADQGKPSSASHLSFCSIFSQRSFAFCFCSLWGKFPNLHIATKSFPGPVLHLMDFSIESERKLNVWWGGSIIRSELFSSPLFHGTVPLEPGSVRSTMAYCSLPLKAEQFITWSWHQMKIPIREHLQWDPMIYNWIQLVSAPIV